MIAPETNWRDARLAVVDVETTGLNDDDRIVELAVVIGERGVVVDTKHWLLNPGRPIPPEATAVHRIRDVDVARAPTFAEIAVEVGEALEGAIPAAFNAPFDRKFVEREWRAASLPRAPFFLAPETQWLDPLVWARQLQKYEKGKKLGDVARRLGIDAGEAHRATADAEAALRVIHAFARNRNLPEAYGALVARQVELAAAQEADFAAWKARNPRPSAA